MAVATVASVAVPANATYIVGQNLDFTVTFSEAVTVTGTPRIAITLDTGGTVYATYQSGSTSTNLVFRYTVTTGTLDTDGIQVGALELNAGTIVDTATSTDAANLTLNAVGATTAVLVDGVLPTVSSITAVGGTTASNATTKDWTVVFSEAVQAGTVTGTDFALTTTGTAAGTVVNAVAQVNATTFTVTTNTISGDGTLRLDFTGAVTDTAGNASVATFNGATATTVDNTAPLITAVGEPANKTYVTGENIDFTVTYGEVVTVTGTPQLALTIGSSAATDVAATANYLSGSGTNTLTFRHTVTVGEFDSNGIAVGANVVLNGGTIRDAATNNASNALVGLDPTIGVLVAGTGTGGGGGGNGGGTSQGGGSTPGAGGGTTGGTTTTPPTSTETNPTLQGGLTYALGYNATSADLNPTFKLADGTTIENPLITQQKAVAAINAQLSAGVITERQAVDQIVDLADGTTSVATLSYAFFTGKTPTQAGVEFLVSSTTNANDLNDAYYAKFNIENRYINFAVNLGKLGEGATKFTADYGSLSFDAAMTKAYTQIFGTVPTAAKIAEIFTPARVSYLATYGGDGNAGIGTKAAAIGFLLAEAVKADVGPMALANEAFLRDSMDGTAAYNVDLVGTYSSSAALNI